MTFVLSCEYVKASSTDVWSISFENLTDIMVSTSTLVA